jgi:succinate dehydrogenase flavin-adding protein (antitoxin of CptAB toxin-antitoxin module)
MRELDELLLDYLTQHYPGAPEPDKAAFRALLELSDPELIEYLLQCVRPASEPIACVVDRILNRTQV